MNTNGAMRPNLDVAEVNSGHAVWDAGRRLWLRPGTLDDAVAGESASYVKVMPPRAGETVLDLGGNIGSVAKAYLDAGAGRVVSVEPEPDNCRMFRANAPQAELIEAACVGGDDVREHTTLYVCDTANRGKHSTYPRTRRSPRKQVIVPVVSMRWLLETYRPALVKCDIEAGEYEIPELGSLPSFVRGLTVEMHLEHPHRGIRVKGKELDEAILASGFELTKARGDLVKSWFSVRTYLR